MDLHLQGRVVLVVGGNGYIGRAVVDRLRQEGATAVAASRHASDGIVLDAAVDESVEAGLDEVRTAHGRLDGLVVTAAPSARTLDPERNSDPAQVREAFDAKAMTFLRVANAALPTMMSAGWGRIVGISGQNAFVTGNIAGSLRNAALILAAKNLADAVVGTGVTVNTVSPGIVTDDPVAEVDPGRSGQCTPDQVASVVTYLLSPLAGAVSGESIAVGHRVRGVTGL